MTSFLPACRSLAPFLYPFSRQELRRAERFIRRFESPRCSRVSSRRSFHCSRNQRKPETAVLPPAQELDPALASRLNPSPDQYNTTPFTDNCLITIHAGSGGHGCVSFLREKFIAEGPANGGDGGSGGNIFIQAVRTETSLSKLSRKKEIKAGRGKNGQGSSQGGQRGADVLIQVPVGTVIREVERHDPVADEEIAYLAEVSEKRRRKKAKKDTPIGVEGADEEAVEGQFRKDKWLVHPGVNLSYVRPDMLPELPRPSRTALHAVEPERPIRIDLDEPMETPRLLVAGALGGMGNPHFISKDKARPKFATKGNGGAKVTLHFELKLLADVGLVGLPNAGKSTLLRAISNSRARVGSWAFTTLQPNIGTVVLDDYKGRPRLVGYDRASGEPRTKFTIADIPGLIEDAHLNKGLGLDFLRHVERAAVLAFVIDLSAGPAVEALKALWREVAEYDALKDRRLNEQTQRVIEWLPSEVVGPSGAANEDLFGARKTAKLPQLILPPVCSKPWFVVATKADKSETQTNFLQLRQYLQAVSEGKVQHPARKTGVWKGEVECLPISAMRGEGVKRFPEVVLKLLNE